MSQDTQRTAELLEIVLSGEQLTSEELDDLLERKVFEDAHLEYKHGKVLKKKGKAPSALIRRYVSGFANGAGGLLLVGVDENDWCVTECKAPGGGSLTRWASDSVNPIAGYLSPPPVFDSVAHPDGEVLIVGVARSPVLVPCYEDFHTPAYYLRMDDKTLRAPEYLVADLVLGRREHAYLAIPDVGMGKRYARPDYDKEMNYDWHFKLHFRVENQGLARANGVRVGVLAFAGRKGKITSPVGSYLRQHVAVAAPSDEQDRWGRHELQHQATAPDTLEPFAVGFLETDFPLSVPLAEGNRFYPPYEWKAAVYLTAADTPPVWYQMTLDVNKDLPKHLQAGSRVHSSGPFLRWERVAAGRPVVGWVLRDS